MPQYNKLRETKLQIAQKQVEIENRQAYFATLNQISIELAQYEANLEK